MAIGLLAFNLLKTLQRVEKQKQMPPLLAALLTTELGCDLRIVKAMDLNTE